MVIAVSLLLAAALQAPPPAVGHTPSPDHLRAIDIEVAPDGKGLAPGGGTAAAGKDVYTRRCETCPYAARSPLPACGRISARCRLETS